VRATYKVIRQALDFAVVGTADMLWEKVTNEGAIQPSLSSPKKCNVFYEPASRIIVPTCNKI